MTKHTLEPYVLSDDDLFVLFCRTAPIIKDPDQRAHAMQTTEGKKNLIIADTFFTLGVRYSEKTQQEHSWDSPEGVETYIMSPSEAISGFTEVLRILPKSLSPSTKSPSFIGAATLYFTLGIRAAEFVQNHHEWKAQITNAGDLQHPQIAIPDVDFPTNEVLNDIKKRIH